MALPARAGDPVERPGARVGLAVAASQPVMMATGQATGVAASVRGGSLLGNDNWQPGLEFAWARASEYPIQWQVTHDELRLRGALAWMPPIGRGSIGVRLQAGATAVHEVRDRAQAGRLDAADALQQTAWALAPGGELLTAVDLALGTRWGLQLAAGPSLHAWQGVRIGWTATLGIGWQP
jgi:hypothetical protein